MTPSTISQARAERIARGNPCGTCGEYSYKRVSAKPAAPSHREELKIAWQVSTTCGVCGGVQELGIDDEGDIVYAG